MWLKGATLSIYIYIYICLSLSLHIYIYICMFGQWQAQPPGHGCPCPGMGTPYVWICSILICIYIYSHIYIYAYMCIYTHFFGPGLRQLPFLNTSRPRPSRIGHTVFQSRAAMTTACDSYDHRGCGLLSAVWCCGVMVPMH